MNEPTIIKIEINCARIDKKRLFRKEGKEGVYLKLVAFKKKELDKWGDVAYLVAEDVTKEEREAKIKGNIIGEAKIPKPKDAPPPATPPAQTTGAAPTARTKKPGLPF